MTELRDTRNPTRTYTNVLRFMENSILGFLQALFGAFPAGCDPRQYHYDDSDELTEIMIEGQGTDNLLSVDTRPKIVVARGPVTWGQTQIGNFVGSKNLSMENRKYSGIYKGSVGISCFSREDLEADQIAQICFDSILSFQQILLKYGFLSLKAVQIGQRGLIKSDARPELSVTPVLLQVEITRNWSTAAIDPVKLRQILVQLVARVPGPNGELNQSLEA